jgi:hypothetical protein
MPTPLPPSLLPLARASPGPYFSHSFALVQTPSSAPPLTAHPRCALPARSRHVTASPLITPMPFTSPEHGRSPTIAGFAPASCLHPASHSADTRYVAPPPPLARCAPLSSLVLAPPRPQHLVGCVCRCELHRRVGRGRGDCAQRARPARRVGPDMWAACSASG